MSNIELRSAGSALFQPDPSTRSYATLTATIGRQTMLRSHNAVAAQAVTELEELVYGRSAPQG